jgi:diadenylate cyclase
MARQGEDLDSPLQAKGYRLLAHIPRLPDAVIGRIIGRFGSLQKLMQATVADLCDVGGIGEARAAVIRDNLDRLADSSRLDRY